jgi:hypothetical protein
VRDSLVAFSSYLSKAEYEKAKSLFSAKSNMLGVIDTLQRIAQNKGDTISIVFRKSKAYTLVSARNPSLNLIGGGFDIDFIDIEAKVLIKMNNVDIFPSDVIGVAIPRRQDDVWLLDDFKFSNILMDAYGAEVDTFEL